MENNNVIQLTQVVGQVLEEYGYFSEHTNEMKVKQSYCRHGEILAVRIRDQKQLQHSLKIKPNLEQSLNSLQFQEARKWQKKSLQLAGVGS